MRFDPSAWAEVHDGRQRRHFAFRRGLALCLELCGERVRPGALWVDVGSGTGHLASALAERGARVVGLDRDPAMAVYARRRWSRPFAVSAAGALALADGTCAGVVAVSLLGCLPDVGDFLAEAARVLAPGGTLCLTAMNRESLLLAAGKAWSWPTRLRSGRYAPYAPAALAAEVRRAGFIPERQVFYGHFLAAGPLVLPRPEATRHLERAVPPGARDAWARQLLLLARRVPGPPG